MGEISQKQFITRKMLNFEHGAAFNLKIKSQAVNNTTLMIRGMTSEGLFAFKHITINDSNPKEEVFRIPDIPIWVSVTDHDFGLTQGACYATISIEINNDTLFELCAGLVYKNKSLSWPYNNSADKRPNGGLLVAKWGADPAVGAEALITVPGNQIWLIKSVVFSLTTSATVATRRVHVEFEFGDGGIVHAPSPVTQAASLAYAYNFAPYVQSATTPFDNDVLVNIPDNIILVAGDVISTNTTNIQVGDALTALIVQIEMFFASD